MVKKTRGFIYKQDGHLEEKQKKKNNTFDEDEDSEQVRHLPQFDINHLFGLFHLPAIKLKALSQVAEADLLFQDHHYYC